MKLYICSDNLIVRSHFKTALQEIYELKLFNDFKSMYSVFKEDTDALVMIESTHSINEMIMILKELNKEVKILITHSKPTFNEGHHLLKLGIKGYANSYINPINLPIIFENIAMGHTWLYPEFIQQMIENSEPTSQKEEIQHQDKLTTKEYDTALLVSKGLSNSDIAQELHLSVSTVKNRISSAFQKLEVNDRLSLAKIIN